jgi:aldehyde dehydrogenase (NAD+)
VNVHDKLYIGGEWVDPATDAVIDVISPHTEEVVGRVPEAATADVDRAVGVARAAFDDGDWPRLAPEERIAAVQRFTDAYMARMGDMAQIITTEMGSPITFSQLGQSGAAWMMLNTFVQIAQQFPWEDTRTGMMGTDVIVRHEPVGVVAGVVPWNVPQFVTIAKLAPALLTGCTFVLKPAPETPLDSYLMAELLDEAGIPKGVVSILPAGREVGEHLVRHAGVDKVAFTGSTAAGRRIAAICGEQLKRVSLELGGKSAAIILDDADLAATVEGLKMASLMNNGQACVAQTRILASRARYDEVVDAVTSMVGGLKVGDPAEEATEIGPLVAKRQQERVEKYIALGQEEGARVTVGGNGVRERDERHAHRSRGDLRTRSRGHPLRRRARRGPDRERQRVRPRRFRVDERRRPGHGHRASRANRHLRGEPVHDGLHGSVRGLQGFRHRSRVRQGRPRALRRAEDHRAARWGHRRRELISAADLSIGGGA